MDGSTPTPPTFVSLPAELLISIFGWLDAADIMALRLTSALLHRLTFDDAALWRPLYLKTFGHSRPCKPTSHTPERSSNAELWQDYHLHIPQAHVVGTLIRRFYQTWEWAYKSRVLDLVELTRKGATCYAMPKVRFPPERWVARRDEPEQGLWRYEGEWSTDLKREGYGACRFLNGNLYCGQWAHDRMHGQGVMLYGDGGVYDGSWCRNARHGKGTYKRPGRWTYCGEWKDGKRCGWGTMQVDAPLVMQPEQAAPSLPKLVQLESLWGVGLVSWKGRWRRNRPEGEGTATFTNGGVYHGKCRNKWRERGAYRGEHYELITFVGLLKRRIPVAGSHA